MDVFSALAEPKRRSILELIARHGQLSASAIAAAFSISSPAVSQHLKILREAKLLRMDKLAQKRIYRINPAALLEVENWAKQTTATWDARFTRLDSVLANEQRKGQGER
jgi:DNA-binding transcriptional ArsR family regulator